ncbi:MAG: hypothetical protein K8J08_12920 [Thermoanaerobaculia bacterium]|nr:hypothetical protein [Thermoanaerobaculia bacterium]
MTNDDLEQLLQPSLKEGQRLVPLYSIRAGFFTAFFGGVFATLILNGLNSWRLGRFGRDVWFYLGAGVLWTAVLLWFSNTLFQGSQAPWIVNPRVLRNAGRVLALIILGRTYLSQRDAYKVQDFVGDDPPNPWPAALGAIAISIGLTGLIVALATRSLG